MAVRPMLDSLELPQVQEIGTYDARSLAEHKPPGADGSHLQNLGRRPTRVALWGVATGPTAATFVAGLEGRFRAGKAVDFAADITTDTGIEKVLIDDLQLQELAGKPDRTAYVLTLRQFIEPLEPADATLLDAGILGDAAALVGQLVDGLALAQSFASH
jgi:hypothetical protein